MSSTIQLRVDDDLKKDSDLLFKDLGTDTSSAIRIFLKQSLACNGFPFEIKKITPDPNLALSEEQILSKLEKSRNHCQEGKFSGADEVVIRMRDKYGL